MSCDDSARVSGPVETADAGGADSADAAADVDISGTWLGTLDVAPFPLRVVLNFERADDGTWSGTADSPDQGAFAIPISRVSVAGDRVDVTIDGAGISLSGTVSSDGQTLTAVATQNGSMLPLTLERQAGPLDYRRPQDPAPPFPYSTAEVTFPSESPGVTLAGTLLWPEGPGPFTTVVLLTGSGPQNRDEELFNHRPFLVLADALARANVAVLRFDDRGVGESSGDFAAAIIPDFASDARGAVAFLRAQEHFPVGSVGLVGHSEGGLVAPLAADENADVGFLVLLAAPGVEGRTVLLTQQRAINTASGLPPAQVDAAAAQQETIFACFEGPEQADEALDTCLRQALIGAGIGQAELAPALAELEAPWLRWLISYDPAPVLRRTQIPVLALNGSLDLQVVASVNVPALRTAFEEAVNEAAVVSELPGYNHLFQRASTGLPAEYGQIEQTMAPEVLTQIAEWIGSLDGEDASAQPTTP